MADGARVGVLAATGSAPGERIAEAAFTVLPSDLAKYTRLFVNGEAIATGEQPVPSLEAEMSDVKAKVGTKAEVCTDRASADCASWSPCGCAAVLLPEHDALKLPLHGHALSCVRQVGSSMPPCLLCR